MNQTQAPIPNFSLKEKLFLFSLGIMRWKIPTYTTGAELCKLYQLIGSSPIGIAVEIGSYIGASSLMIAKGLAKGGTLYCIDTWKNDAMTEGNWDTLAEFKKNTHSVKDRIQIFQSSSMEAAAQFDKPIDYIFIDGDHSYEGVKADIEAWFPKLKKNGIIVMHDVGWAEGVIKVIEEDIKPAMIKHDRLPNMFWGWKK